MTGHRLLCKDFVCFDTTPCPHVPLVLIFVLLILIVKSYYYTIRIRIAIRMCTSECRAQIRMPDRSCKCQ